MNIAYFDLHKNDIHEDYSIYPKRYGGAATFARYAKQILNNKDHSFKILALKDSFSSYTDEDNKNFYALNDDQINAINSFHPIKDVISDIDLSDLDIIMFHHDFFTLNTQALKAKKVYWPLVGNSTCHPNNDLMLLYSKNLQCYYNPSTTKIALFQIGVNVPDSFNIYNKENLIFQCTQHVDTFNSIEVAKKAIEIGYKAIFAGPIFNNYNLLDYIDNKNTFYLGQISEEEKILNMQKAKFSTFLHKHETPFNLSILESMAYGVVPICSNNTFFRSIINNDNGFIYNGSFKEAAENYNTNMQINCYNTAKMFSKENMIISFLSAVQILNH
jgi:glycosyltransferase involved in cell wall biosynthesis